ncbi:MAG TPA: lamin tail domain-containing protein [Actinoplanes sp.]|jgi:hypothetical protein
MRTHHTARIAAAILATGTLLTVATPATAAPRRQAIQIMSIQYDSPGRDNGSNKSLNAEWVEVQNTGQTRVDLEDWTLSNGDREFEFPEFTLRPGRTVMVHTGKGYDGEPRNHDLYWGSSKYAWGNDSDTATLHDDDGRRVDVCEWDGDGEGWTDC